MKVCQFCGKKIPQERLSYPRVKYCSDLCNKRAYSVRHKTTKACRFVSSHRKWLRTETGMAFFWEKYASDLIVGEHLNESRMNKPADIKFQNKLVDVKTAKLYKRKLRRGKPTKSSGWWLFRYEKLKPEIDFFLCIGLLKNNVEKMWLFPSSVFYDTKTGLTITRHSSSYNQYLFTSKTSFDKLFNQLSTGGSSHSLKAS